MLVNKEMGALLNRAMRVLHMQLVRLLGLELSTLSSRWDTRRGLVNGYVSHNVNNFVELLADMRLLL